MNVTLESLARAIFKSWFVDFDPVKVNAGQMPASAQATHDPKVLDLFPSTFQESELGPIPEGWSVGTLADVTDVQGGYAFKSRDFIEDGECPVIKIKNIQDDRSVDVGNAERLPSDFQDSAAEYLLDSGDLLMAMTGAKVAKFGIIVTTSSPTLLNQRVARFQPIHAEQPWFVFGALSMPDVLNQVIANAKGSAQPNVSASGIKAAKLVIPPPNLVAMFCDSVSSLFEERISHTKESRFLEATRDELLPHLLSGQMPETNLDGTER